MITKEEFLAGWLGGVIGIVIGHPFDTMKVRQQIHNKSIMNTFQSTFKLEGIKGFWKGISLPLATAGVHNAIFFGTFYNAMKYLSGYEKPNNTNDPNFIRNLWLASAIAGLVQVTFVNPVEVIKTKLQVRTGANWRQMRPHWQKDYEQPFSTPLQLTLGIYKNEGIKGFFVGYIPLAIRDVPTYGLYMWTYIAADKWMGDHHFNEFLRQTIAGGLAGVVSWVPAVPFDTVKSKMQTLDSVCPKYKNMIDCIIKTYIEGGIYNLFRGTTLICLRVFPMSAATFYVYHQTMKYFEKTSNEK